MLLVEKLGASFYAQDGRSTPPLLVGEDNPHNDALMFALWPSPPGCAGDRLCRRILGLTSREYLRKFARANLCSSRWDADEAKERASELRAWNAPIILLGSKVAASFGMPYEPFSVQTSLLGDDHRIFIMPHPSGRCLIWNDPRAAVRARDLLKEYLL